MKREEIGQRSPTETKSSPFRKEPEFDSSATSQNRNTGESISEVSLSRVYSETLPAIMVSRLNSGWAGWGGGRHREGISGKYLTRRSGRRGCLVELPSNEFLKGPARWMRV